MLKKTALRLLALLLVIVTLLAVVGCNTLYDIRSDDMDKPWEDGEPDGDGADKDNDNNGNNDNDNNDNDNNNDGTDDNGDGSEPIPPMEIPDLEGATITILYRDNPQSSREWYKTSPEDEIDEAIALRNIKVMDDLNVVVEYEPVPDSGYDQFTANFNAKIANDVTSDIHAYDIAANFAYSGAYTEVRGYAANLLNKEVFPYFNFKNPAWNQSMVENTTLNGRLHYVTGAANLSYIDSTMLLWYNKALYDIKKTESDPADLTQFALDGNWTYEKMYNMVAAIDPDTDGFFGFSGSDYRSGHPCDLLPVAWDLDLIVENENGTHSLNLENNSKLKDIISKYADLASRKASRGSWYAMRDFANGGTLFAKGSFYNPYGEDAMLREMSDQHSFLPWPKYDTDQTEYYTTSQDYYTLLTAIDHSGSTKKTQGEAVSAYLQLLTEVSHESVLPLYRKSRVEKNSNIPNTENVYKMYDLIVGSITYDFRTVYSPQLNNITWLWRDYMNSSDEMMAKYLDNIEAYHNAVYDTDLWLGLASLER